jgi:hypothetical protein
MKWLKALGAAAAAVAVALLVWLIVGNDVANRRLVAVEKAWRDAPGDLDDFAARFPNEETNGAAHHLEAAAAPLDIDLRPRSDVPAGSSLAIPDRANRDRQLLREYLDAELSKASGEAASPSPEAATVLDRMAPHLGAVKKALAGGEPRWRMEAVRGFEARIPNLLGQIQLQRVLLSSALREASRKDASTANSLLEASWALNAPLLARPELISQLIAVAVCRMQAGVIRKAPGPSGPWIARLGELDPRKGILESFRGEAWAMREAMRRGVTVDVESGEPTVPSRIGALVRGPGERLSSCEYLGGLRELVVVAGSRPVSEDSGQALRSAFESGASRWGRAPGAAAANLIQAFERVDRLVVDLELTRKVLEARAARGMAKEWPAIVPGVESTVLKGAQWNYAVTPDGHASIELSRRLDWGKTFGLVLPTRWVSANGDAFPSSRP